jgi:hypothetical protein
VSRFVCLAVGLLLCLPALLQAQFNPYGQRGRQQPNLQPTEITGTLQGMASGGIVVANSTSNQVWRVAIAPATKVQVTGTTTAEALRSGVIVELTAEIDSHGAIQGKIDTLTITTVTREKPVGIYPADAGGFGDKPADDATKPEKPAKRTGRTAAKGGSRGQQAAGTYRIVGKLAVGRGGALAVQAGRGMLQFELAEQAKINVDTTDIRFATRGSEVTVSGMAMPNRPGVAQALDVKVKLPETQAAEKPDKPERKEAADKAEAKKAAKRAKKDKDEGLPEPPADK